MANKIKDCKAVSSLVSYFPRFVVKSIYLDPKKSDKYNGNKF